MLLTQELIEAQLHDAAEDPQSALLSGRTAETLTEADKIVRDAFCREYIKDFRGGKAMHRIGVTNPKTANTKASIWLREAYCQARIRELVRDLKETDIVDRNDIMAALWKEANNPDNEGGTRVQSLTTLAKMIGAIGPGANKGVSDENTLPTNLLLMPVVSFDDWANQAGTMQRTLMHNAAARRVPIAMPPPPPKVIDVPAA